MNVQQIYENEVAVLDLNELEIAKEMKRKNPNLPFVVDKDRIVFDAYTIGSIRVNDTVINILPRSEAFDLSTIFEMLLFTYDIIVNNEKAVGYNYTDQNGVWVIPQYFASECRKLTNFGLTGGYKKRMEVSDCLKGDILLEKFNSNIIKSEGIHYVRQDYTLDVPANQIIKSALIKITRFNPDNNPEYSMLLREFDAISEYNGNVLDFEKQHTGFFSSNPFYPEVIRVAITLLKDMKLSFNHGSIQWYSFLQNSNDLFETYARKLVEKVSPFSVQKWDAPKDYASINYNGKTGFKSYIPDILLGYDDANEHALVVLDAKNKHFNPQDGSLSELVSAADMYQLLFYCRKLKTKFGGLIYPAKDNYEPISVIVDDDADLRIVLFSINMKLNYRERAKKLKKDLNEALLKYI